MYYAMSYNKGSRESTLSAPAGAINRNGVPKANEFADCVLIDILIGEAEEYNVWYNYYGTNVLVDMYAFNGKTYVYYILNQEIRPKTNNIIAAVSRIYRHEHGFSLHDPANFIDINRGFSTKNKKQKLSKILNKEATKISASYHLHYSPVEALRAVPKDKLEQALWVCHMPEDVNQAMVTGMILWLASLAREELAVAELYGLFSCKDIPEFRTRAKAMSKDMKALQHMYEADFRSLFEADVLVNRVYDEVDWEQERENRENPVLAEIDPETIFEKALEMFQLAQLEHSTEVKTMDWDEYWKSRWQWSAAGSVKTQYPEDLKHVYKERELKNKFVTLSDMPNKEIEEFLQREPSIYAYTSTKYEWGKVRAIYGTDLTSYILTNFAYYNCEELLTSNFPIGKRANETFVRRKVGTILSDALPLCTDFEDFNSQHSIPSMQAVMRAYEQAYNRQLSEEQKKAAEWARQSVEKMVIVNNLTGDQYTAKGTLMSGWRLTTFINTVLNYIYCSVLFEDHKTLKRTVHNGDDVLSGITNMAVAFRATRNAITYKIRIQFSKSVLGGLSEFLRVDHSAKGSGQYLTRGIATLVHGRIESKPAVNVFDRIEANEMRLSEAEGRGLLKPVAVALREMYLSRMAAKYAMSLDDCYGFIHAHRVVGGMSDRLQGDLKNIYTVEAAKEPVQELERMLESPGVQHYSEAVYTALKETIPINEVVTGIKNATRRALMCVRYFPRVRPNSDVQQSRVYRAIYKVHKDDSIGGDFGKAKLVGRVFDVLSRNNTLPLLTAKLAYSNKPAELLSILL